MNNRSIRNFGVTAGVRVSGKDIKGDETREKNINYSDFFRDEKIVMTFLSILGFFIGRISIFHMLNPIAISFLGCILLKGKIFNLALTFTFLGFLSNSNKFYLIKYIICIALLFAINMMFSNSISKSSFLKRGNTTLIRGALTSVSILIASSYICIINSFSFYYFVISILETVLTFCVFIILDRGIFFLTSNKKRLMANEEIISISMLAGAILCGTSDLMVGGVSFTYFFLTMLLFFVTYTYGSAVGGVVSLLCGFLLIISTSINTDLIILLSISSIIAGVFRESSKPLFLIAFDISILIIALFIDMTLLDKLVIYSIAGSNLVFMFVPCKLRPSISFSNDKEDLNATYGEKIQALTSNKLENYANSFYRLSETFEKLSDKKLNLEQEDISNLIDDVASKACTSCEMRQFCWEKNFYRTYQSIFSILNNCEDNGEVNKNLISEEFARECINIGKFVDILDKTFEIYKINLIWKNKVIESRELVGKQLSGVSEVISNLSKNLSENVSFKENLETKIKYHLEENGIVVKSIIITENEKRKIEVALKVEPCYIPSKCNKTIIPLVSEILDKKMCRSCYDCLITKQNNESICSILLIEEQNFRITTSAICIPKDGASESGDSHTFSLISSGNYLLALSDGMGSGSKARAESSATIELLEEFMQAGFSKDLAINMINSVLLLKSSKESFATLDICNIDLYTGICEFIKIGAVATFLVHNGKVEVIQSNSLPVGILNNIQPEVRQKKLSEDDVIVMISDGVMDSANLIINKENWIINILQNNTSKNPEEIAKTIVEKTRDNYNGKIKDDITVMVSRVWKNRKQK